MELRTATWVIGGWLYKMKTVRPVFLVLLADNDHGKTTLVRCLVSQGMGRTIKKQMKGPRLLVTPHGREVDAYVFGRSYQEVEKGNHHSVEQALSQNDPYWRKREFILMPSHVSDISDKHGDDLDQMIDAAHGAGFDIICASVEFAGNFERDRQTFASIWRKPWDMRWRVPNPETTNYEGQLDALGRDLWTWVSRALLP